MATLSREEILARVEDVPFGRELVAYAEELAASDSGYRDALHLQREVPALVKERREEVLAAAAADEDFLKIQTDDLRHGRPYNYNLLAERIGFEGSPYETIGEGAGGYLTELNPEFVAALEQSGLTWEDLGRDNSYMIRELFGADPANPEQTIIGVATRRLQVLAVEIGTPIAQEGARLRANESWDARPELSDLDAAAPAVTAAEPGLEPGLER